jgi:ABC-2 type transport system permease protein
VIVAILTVIVPLLFVLLTAVFGVAVNLKLPNLKWTNETVPVKQGMAVGLSLLGGFLVIGALAVGYFFLTWLIPAWLYLLLCGVVFAAVTVCLSIWLYYRGTKIFVTL